MLTDQEVAELRWSMSHPKTRCGRIHVILKGGPLDGVCIHERAGL